MRIWQEKARRLRSTNLTFDLSRNWEEWHVGPRQVMAEILILSTATVIVLLRQNILWGLEIWFTARNIVLRWDSSAILVILPCINGILADIPMAKHQPRLVYQYWKHSYYSQTDAYDCPNGQSLPTNVCAAARANWVIERSRFRTSPRDRFQTFARRWTLYYRLA